MSLAPNLIGALVLVLPVTVLAALVPASAAPKLLWLFIYLATLVVAVFCWRHERAPGAPGLWLLYAWMALISALALAMTGVTLSDLSGSYSRASFGIAFEKNPILMIDALGLLLGAFIAFSGAARQAVIDSILDRDESRPET